MSIYILLQINFAIKNFKKVLHNSGPAPVFQEVFSERPGFPVLEGHSEGCGCGMFAAKVEERGCSSWESLAKATPRPVLIWSLACLAASPVFLT